MTRLYRYLLVLLPRSLRVEFGDDMTALFEKQRREVQTRGQRWVFYFLAVKDVVAQSLVARLERRGVSPPPIPNRKGRPMDSLGHDVRYALRSLGASPGFVLVTVVTLGLGIGATSTVYSVVEAVLLQPLPYPEPERVVRVFDTSPTFPEFALTPANFLDYREAAQAFDAFAIYHRGDAEISMGESPERVSGMLVSSGFFRVVGIEPMLGRGFTREEETPANSHVAILSERFWDTRYQRDPDVVGAKLVVDGEPHTVVGVAPDRLKHVGGRFRSLPHGTTVDIWRPFPFAAEPMRFAHYLNGIARLAPGVTVAQAEAEMNVIAERLEREYPDVNEDWRIALMSLHEEIVRDARPTLLVLFGAVALVLLIACVNVANLLLVRGASRQQELALRSALGAGRRRLVGQLLTESVLLAIAGGMLGVAIAAATVRWLPVLGGEGIPRLDTVAIDGSIVLFAFLTTLATSVAFGTVPALRLSGARMSFSQSRSSDSRDQRRLRGAFVVAELSLAIVLLVGAGLLSRTLVNLQTSDPGFRPESVLTAKVSPPQSRYPEGDDTARLFERLVERFQTVPGVVAAGAGSNLPWSGYDENFGFEPEGRPEDRFGARFHFATPGYFRALGMPLVYGRAFERSDDANAPRRVVVNAQLANEVWGDENPVEYRVSYSSEPTDEDWWTVIGVVSDVKDDPSDERAKAAIYMPFSQNQWTRELLVAVRTRGEPEAVLASLRSELAALDKDLPLAEVATLEDVSDRAFAEPRFLSWLTTTFAAVALGLAVIGLYGVISYTVSLETRAIAIRMAVGARATDVIGEVLRRSLRLVITGVFIGIVGAPVAARALESMLYDVAPYDPMTLVVVTLILGATTLLASLGPARRTSRVDPMQTLRSE